MQRGCFVAIELFPQRSSLPTESYCCSALEQPGPRDAEPRRTLEIAALLSVLAARQSDTVLRLVEMRIAEIWTWAHALARPEPPGAVPDEAVRELAQAMDDPALSDAEFRANARTLLAPWARGAGRTRNTRAAQVRERLANDRRRIRPLLKSLIPLRLQGAPGDPVIPCANWS